MSSSVSVSPITAEETSLWSEAGTLYRRICLLRIRGHSVEAARLQSTELSKTVSLIRQSVPEGAECDVRLKEIFALEEERITNASVLAEILLPMLREAVPPAAIAQRANPARQSGVEGRSPRRSLVAAPGIADFIDEMIQQERATPGAAAP